MFALATAVIASPAAAQDAATPSAAVAAPAAQPVSADQVPTDIVVTARRREETSILIPVAVTALSQSMIERQNITTRADRLDQHRRRPAQPGQCASARADRHALDRDPERPQALFFGKNSPAEVIAVRTADPGDVLEIMARGGYEFNAYDMRGDLVVSAWLADTFGVRVALSTNSMDGYHKNLAGLAMGPANAIRPRAVTGFQPRGPEQEFYFARGTLKWAPSSAFDARGKFTYAKVNGIGYQQGGGFQRIYCPNGVPFQNNQATALNGGVLNPALAASLAARRRRSSMACCA